MKMRKILATLAAAVVACSTLVVSASAADEKYNGYMQVQTDNWTFRNDWNDGTYGLGKDQFSHLTGWVDDAETDFGGTFTDVEITGSGTYTVKLDGKFDLNGATGFNSIGVGTNIPADKTVKFTNVKLSFDGKEVYTAAEGVVSMLDTDKYYKLEIANKYNNDLGVDMLKDAGVPTTSIEITFDVSITDPTTESTTSTPASSTPASSTGAAGGTTNPTTGATAGLALAGLAIAGAAVVAAKKSK